MRAIEYHPCFPFNTRVSSSRLTLFGIIRNSGSALPSPADLGRPFRRHSHMALISTIQGETARRGIHVRRLLIIPAWLEMELPSRAPLPPPEKSPLFPTNHPRHNRECIQFWWVLTPSNPSISLTLQLPTPYAGEENIIRFDHAWRSPIFHVKTGPSDCESHGHDLVTTNHDVESDIHTRDHNGNTRDVYPHSI